MGGGEIDEATNETEHNRLVVMGHHIAFHNNSIVRLGPWLLVSHEH